ncbi:unnamed protein product, partial [Sphacelaria rigidula]
AKNDLVHGANCERQCARIVKLFRHNSIMKRNASTNGAAAQSSKQARVRRRSTRARSTVGRLRRFRMCAGGLLLLYGKDKKRRAEIFKPWHTFMGVCDMRDAAMYPPQKNGREVKSSCQPKQQKRGTPSDWQLP